VARYIDRNRYDWLNALWKLAVFVGIAAVAIFVVYPSRGVFWAFAMVLFAAWVFVSLMARSSAYRCGGCGKIFQVPTMINFVTPSHMAKNKDGTYYNYKILPCPHCGKKTQAKGVKRAETRGAGSGRALK
jgi:hypothetical protein